MRVITLEEAGAVDSLTLEGISDSLLSAVSGSCVGLSSRFNT